MQDNEFETKENKIWIKDKIEPQHRYESYFQGVWLYISLGAGLTHEILDWPLKEKFVAMHTLVLFLFTFLLEMASVTPFLGDECTT